jgi:hypothetical protein
MSDLFSATPQTYPDDAICAVDTCGHKFRDHKGNCGSCLVNQGRGFSIEDPGHAFKPRLLAGRALTPNAEREAYERALRGL